MAPQMSFASFIRFYLALYSHFIQSLIHLTSITVYVPGGIAMLKNSLDSRVSGPLAISLRHSLQTPGGC